MSDSDILKDISDDLRYYIKETVANSVYKNADTENDYPVYSS